MPLANLFGHGDVRVRKVSEFRAMAEEAGLEMLSLEAQKDGTGDCPLFQPIRADF